MNHGPRYATPEDARTSAWVTLGFLVFLVVLVLLSVFTDEDEPKGVTWDTTEPFKSRILPVETLDDPDAALRELEDMGREMDEIFDGLQRYQELLELEMKGKLWSA